MEVTINSCTFKNSVCTNCYGLLFTGILLTTATITNSSFSDSDISGYSYLSFKNQSGDIDIQDCIFDNLTSNESVFMTIGIPEPSS